MLDMNKVKTSLEERLTYLEGRVQEMEAALRSEHSSNFSEQAHEREDEEVMERLEEEALHEIVAIKNAMGRLESGNYGVCTSCADDISEKRLEALPYTGVCIKCAD